MAHTYTKKSFIAYLKFQFRLPLVFLTTLPKPVFENIS